jgi:hypothetical protein
MEDMDYESTITVDSKVLPGVRVTVRRMSFGRRLELTRQVKQLLSRLEFLAAGEASAAEEVEAALAASEIDRVYVGWGLAGVEGLEIDGRPATAELLLDAGPESLVAEALALIRREAGLSEEERKNFESHSISAKENRPDGNATNAAA